MRKSIVIILGSVLLVAGILFAIQLKPPSVSEQGKIKVAATIFPLHDIVRNVAGDAAQVVLVLPPGASPHFFEFTPRSLEQLQGAQAVFAIGHGVDDWASGVAKAVGGGDVVVVDKGVALRTVSEDEEAGHEDEEEEGHAHEAGVDPHYWLSFANAKHMTETVRDTLVALDPDNAHVYTTQAEAYLTELEAVQTELLARAQAVHGRRVITLHDAFAYFAQEFGVDIVGTFEPRSGEEPSPRYLAELARAVEEFGVEVIFGEPQLATTSLDQFAKEHGLVLGILDPLGGVPGRDSFILLMRYNVEELLRAFARVGAAE